MSKTKIEWATYTWNPVTGCLHGCAYCYARGIAKRFGTRKNAYWEKPNAHICHWNGEDMPILYSPIMFTAESTEGGDSGFPIAVNPYPAGFTPTLHRYLLDKPETWKKPQNIFVCSMADLFGEWVPQEWINAVFDACEAPQHNYLFLTKNPAGIERAIDNHACEDRHSNECYEFFDHFWFGTTITNQMDIDRIPVLSEIEEGHRFLSIEPLMEPITLDFKKNRCPNCGSSETYEDNPMTTPAGVPHVYCDFCYEWEGNTHNDLAPDIDWVIIGAETGKRPGKIIPKLEWVTEIVNQCHAADVPVFLKNSLADIWDGDLVQEYPKSLGLIAKKGHPNCGSLLESEGQK